jgi:RNA polymerase sigma factor (sigma-70 family)
MLEIVAEFVNRDHVSRHSQDDRPDTILPMTRSPDVISAELLVIRCRRRDPEAWGELVDKYNDRLFYYIRRLVSDEHHARELLQDAWVQALRGIGHVRLPERLAPWLYTIARRVVFGHYRKQFDEPDAAAVESLDNIAEPEPETDSQFANAELVHFGLSQIGLVEREVLTLHFLEEFSVEQIAGILEVPRGTVKSRLWRARTELRRVLEREAGRGEPEKPLS